MELTRRRFFGGLAAVGSYFALRSSGMTAWSATTSLQTATEASLLSKARARFERDEWAYAWGQVCRERGYADQEIERIMLDIERRWLEGWRQKA